MINLLQYSFMQNALLSGIFIAISCSILGVFLVLKKNIFISEGLAHVSFSGIAIGLLFGFSPILSALTVTIITSILILFLYKKTKIHNETIIGILSYSGFALGILLISISKGFNSSLFGYLFGNILMTSRIDVIVSLIVLVFVISFVKLFYNELRYIVFNETNAKISGIEVDFINYLFSILLAIIIVLAMRIVGIVLIAAFMIIPAATAIKISKNFKQTLILSIVISIISVILGLIISYYLDLASSSTIVLTNLVIFLLTLVKK